MAVLCCGRPLSTNSLSIKAGQYECGLELSESQACSCGEAVGTWILQIPDPICKFSRPDFANIRPHLQKIGDIFAKIICQILLAVISVGVKGTSFRAILASKSAVLGPQIDVAATINMRLVREVCKKKSPANFAEYFCKSTPIFLQMFLLIHAWIFANDLAKFANVILQV